MIGSKFVAYAAVFAAGAWALGAAVGPAALAQTSTTPTSTVQGPDAGTPGTLNQQYAEMQIRRPAPAPDASVLDAPVLASSVVAPPVAPGPAVALAHRVVEQATAFAIYTRHGAGIAPHFTDGVGVAQALDVGATYEPSQLQEGQVAYVAVVALQDPAFVAGVQAWAQGENGARRGAAEEIYADPLQVLEIEGAESAGLLASAALTHAGAALVDAGLAVKKSAYDVQKDGWSKAPVADAQARLARTKTQSQTHWTPGEADSAEMIKAVVALRRSTPLEADADAEATPVVARGLAVAALAVLGRAGEADSDKIAVLLAEPRSADCLKMAKLNLFQCMAVAGPQYEDLFCLGQHAMAETGQCVMAAGGPPARQSVMPAVTPAPAAPRSVMMPIAIATAGPDPR